MACHVFSMPLRITRCAASKGRRSETCPIWSVIKLVYIVRSDFQAFYDRDPVDVALDWAPGTVPVIMPANDKRPGGDWEAGVMSPEECLCRRSNLFGTITTPSNVLSSYPLPSKAGIFSEKVGQFLLFWVVPRTYSI
jgi:hypothetical protein